ncbi:MAG: PH domain-containing protein [Lactobacillaceae bacterium]|jgi:hypothetical protein|nr:PH domain-containing protein [Lactobacillaceae bacterium]
MKTAQEMYTYARQNKLGFNWTLIIGPWLQKKHFKLIEESLLDSEEVLVSFIGRHKPEDGINSPTEQYDPANHRQGAHEGRSEEHTRVRHRDTIGFFGYAITTEQRIIYAHWKPFHHDTTNIPLSNINNVNPDTGMIWGSVKVETFGDSFSVWWTKNVVHRIAKEIQRGISDSKDGAMDGVLTSNHLKNTVDTPTNSLHDDLQQMKQSLDEGLITQADYDAYKQKILDK